jgi:hypothetical protein
MLPKYVLIVPETMVQIESCRRTLKTAMNQRHDASKAPAFGSANAESCVLLSAMELRVVSSDSKRFQPGPLGSTTYTMTRR